ncbi:MAG: glutamine--fructose-6-phosphate transaminase (isomerizing) [Thermodesulfobacteriota bacterium]|nr:glutamine--fructose-6-phosphate transaminase (isomerizing) [Thermodesulfobacteriota bacterium]
MCGIIGYIGKRQCTPIITDGLKRLEYRGYDSAGIAVFHNKEIEIRRCKGKLRDLESIIKEEELNGTVGIGHTRWATHGRPSEENAHPHKAGGVVVVHNGIIENYLDLKGIMMKKGRTFKSETDTEVISHLIERFMETEGEIESAVINALKELRGSYALGILYEKEPRKLIAARKESPLIIGLGHDEFFVASDIPAILNHTRKVVFLGDNEIAIFSDREMKIVSLDGKEVIREPKDIQWDPVMAEKGGYKHFMLKEIFEQPRSITDTIRGRIFQSEGRISLDELNIDYSDLLKIKRILIIACGTSFYASLVGKFLFEEFCRIPVEADLGSEFRYRDPIIDKDNLSIFISQSGETADTLAALKEAKRKSSRVISICNALENSISRESDGTLYTHAGPEIGVASTKAFTTQLAALYILALYIAGLRGTINPQKAENVLENLIKIPHMVAEILKQEKEIERIAKKYFKAQNFLFLGRGINYPIALEGALKLKEISYIHAEGYPAGEMKHGPIALIDNDMPVVVLISEGITYEKVLNNVEEVKARRGAVIAIANSSHRDIEKRVDDIFFIPQTLPLLNPILFAIPLQLFAYHIAVLRGTDVDQPRNLAKSVTVE